MVKSLGINLPRDVFLHLLAIITLIVSAVSFGMLVFQYINVYIPDIISDPYFSKSSYYGSMRYALATMVIVFPVFIWASWFLRRDVLNLPEKRELKIRKWLLYLTLFAAALVIMGDLVALLRSFLEGELSQRFIFKVFTILFIAGSVFVHYLYELKDKNGKHEWVKIFDSAVISIVVVGIVAGFLIAGSPQSQRLVRLDERRVSDLQTIQWQIVNYWQRKEILPANLSELIDPIGGFILPHDPALGSNYEYSVTGDLSFQLCASFDTSSLEGENGQMLGKVMPASPAGLRYGDFEYPVAWNHEKGRTCFERTIDPELYPPVGKSPKPIPL